MQNNNNHEAAIIDGKAFAAGLRERVAKRALALAAEHGVVPGLAVVLVGDDPASEIYVRSKARLSKKAGMNSFEHRYPADTSQAEIAQRIVALNADPNVHGILVQLPMPDHIDANTITEMVDPRKDVDGLHSYNVARLATGMPGMVPCTPLGCLLLLRDQLGDLAGKHAVVVGRSHLVGKPLAQLLLGENCTVTMAHSYTRDLPEHTRRADIVVAAAGQPEFVKGDWIKPGATVIDVGVNRMPPAEGEKKGKIVGDVEFQSAVAVAGAISPVPGGVGPMTIACLLLNTLKAAKAQHGLSVDE